MVAQPLGSKRGNRPCVVCGTPVTRRHPSRGTPKTCSDECAHEAMSRPHRSKTGALKRPWERTRQREERARLLIEAAKVRTLRELGGEIGLTLGGASALLKRLGLELPKPSLVHAQCRQCRVGFEITPGRLKQANGTPLCPSCLQARRERVTVTCLLCRRSRELAPGQAQQLATPFCLACWDSLSPQERRSWRLRRRRRG